MFIELTRITEPNRESKIRVNIMNIFYFEEVVNTTWQGCGAKACIYFQGQERYIKETVDEIEEKLKRVKLCIE